MNESLLYLSRHNFWATKTLLDLCGALSTDQLSARGSASFGSIIETFNHVVMSDGGYLRSLGGPEVPWIAARPPEYWTDDAPMPPGASLDELTPRVDETEQLWESFLASEPFDPERTITLDNGTYECPTGIVMAQAFHHGSIHREQICAMLTSLGIEPPDIQPWGFADATGVSRFLGGRTS